MDYSDLHASFFGYSLMLRVIFLYSPGNVGLNLVNNGLSNVPEGGMMVITRKDLFIQTDQHRNFTFLIARGPLHGSLNLIDPRTSSTISKGVSSFMTSQLTRRSIAYQHDNSENKEDSFIFTATPNVRESAVNSASDIEEYRGSFEITMTMRNDNPPERAIDKVLYVVMGRSKTITIWDLKFVDPDIDFDDSQLMYQRQHIAIGSILDKQTRAEVFNFTQQDLMDQRLMFRHDGRKNSARVPILVSDGQFISNSILEIRASQPFIRITGNLRLQVESGRKANLSSANIGVEYNLDSPQEDVIFRIYDNPKHGQLIVNGNINADFSLLDLLKGNVKYQHDGTGVVSDEVSLNVTVQNLIKPFLLYIDISSFDASGPPTIVRNEILRVNALQIQVITSRHLMAKHKSYLPKEIGYIVTKPPRHGHLVLAGKPMEENPRFSQEDIDRRFLVYASDSPVHLSDAFSFDVGTEFESVRNVGFSIEIIPEKMQTTQANITIQEGGVVTLERNLFALSGQMSGTDSFAFSVDIPPIYGAVVVKNNQVKVESLPSLRTFTLEDLNARRVAYRHGGSESSLDTISIKALPRRDYSSHPGETLTVFITILPVDDQPPRIVINSGLDLWSGSLVQLTGKNLKALDPDTASPEILFTVLDPPNNGHLAFLNNTFRAVTKFSQMDLDAGKLVFVHKGVEYGQFTVRVTDGKNVGGSATVRVRAKPVILTMVTPMTLQAFPYCLQPLTNKSLLATVSASNYSHPLIYTLVSPQPQRGHLVTKLGKQVVEVKSFTQDEVDQGKVFYQSTASIREWYVPDRLTFEVSTAYAKTLKAQVMAVNISYANINEDNYRDLFKIKTKNISEGGEVTISTESFNSDNFIHTVRKLKRDAFVYFTFVAFPPHGKIFYKLVDAKLGEVFTQKEIDAGDIVYSHDHSNTLEDHFVFGTTLVVPRTGDDKGMTLTGSQLHFNFTFAVDPVNDGRFEFLTRFPQLNLLQGSEAMLTRHILSTVDMDTGPEGLEYVINTQPQHGMLVLQSAPTTRIKSFTQLQINNKEVMYKHDGSPRDRDVISLQVSDNRFSPFHFNLNILVDSLSIEVARDGLIPLVQGTRSVTLSNEQLKVSTNGDASKISYVVVQDPLYGRLIPTSQFSQGDLEQGKVRYIQAEDATREDFFVVKISLTYANVVRERVTFSITQRPLVRSSGPLVVRDGAGGGSGSISSHVAITQSVLDVSELARLSNDDPRFTIHEPPRHGRLVLRQEGDSTQKRSWIRSRRQADGGKREGSTIFTPVSEFTFDDIVFTRVFYESSPSAGSASEDKLGYILSARGVPPAKGELLISFEEVSGEINASFPTTGENKPTFPPFDGIFTGSDTDDDDEDDDDNQNEVDSDEDENADDEINGKDETDADPRIEGVGGESGSEGGNGENIIIIIVVILIVLLLLGLVVLAIILLRKRRAREAEAKNKKLASKPRPLISSPLQLSQARPEEENAGDLYNHDSSSHAMLTVPFLISDEDQPEGEAIALVSSPSANSVQGLARKSDSVYVNTGQVRSNPQGAHINSSPDVTLVTTAPKVRPESESSVSEDAGERRSTITSGRGSSASGEMGDWSLVDPDLLQSCNLAAPALRSNQYWL